MGVIVGAALHFFGLSRTIPNKNRALSFLNVCEIGHPLPPWPALFLVSIPAGQGSSMRDVLWFRVHLDPRYHAMLGLEWLGYVGTHCDQILLIEDVEDEQRVIKPEQACPACLAALEREQ